MIRKSEGAMGMLWPLFLATVPSRNPHLISPRKSRTRMVDGAAETVFSRRFQCTINRPNPCLHRGVHLRRIRQVYSDLYSSEPVQTPILMLVLTASKVCNHFRHSLSRPTHHVRNDRHCSHHDHSRYMLR